MCVCVSVKGMGGVVLAHESEEKAGEGGSGGGMMSTCLGMHGGVGCGM